MTLGLVILTNKEIRPTSQKISGTRVKRELTDQR